MKRTLTKLIHEGDYVAEVAVAVIDSDEGWAPYISLDDASMLDEIRESLRRGDTRPALAHGRVYSVTELASKVAEGPPKYKTD